MTMGDRIKAARLAAGMSQQELAGHVGMGRNTISKPAIRAPRHIGAGVRSLAAAGTRTSEGRGRGHRRGVRCRMNSLMDAIVDALTEVLMQLLGLDTGKKGR